MISLLVRAALAFVVVFALTALLTACASTQFVPTVVETPRPKAPPECTASVPGDLLPLPKARSGSSPEDVAASWATVHRRNRGLYRDALQKRTICKEYVRRAGL